MEKRLKEMKIVRKAPGTLGGVMMTMALSSCLARSPELGVREVERVAKGERSTRVSIYHGIPCSG